MRETVVWGEGADVAGMQEVLGRWAEMGLVDGVVVIGKKREVCRDGGVELRLELCE